jgi:transposase
LELSNNQNGNGVVSVRRLTKQPGAPSKTTVYRWQQQEKTKDSPKPPPPIRGRPVKLSEGEWLVVGGWVMEQDKQHHIVSGA